MKISNKKSLGSLNYTRKNTTIGSLSKQSDFYADQYYYENKKNTKFEDNALRSTRFIDQSQPYNYLYIKNNDIYNKNFHTNPSTSRIIFNEETNQDYEDEFNLDNEDDEEQIQEKMVNFFGYKPAIKQNEQANVNNIDITEYTKQRIPIYHFINNDVWRNKLEKLSDYRFTCKNCGKNVVGIETIGVWDCQMNFKIKTPNDFFCFSVRSDHTPPSIDWTKEQPFEIPASIVQFLGKKPIKESIYTPTNKKIRKINDENVNVVKIIHKIFRYDSKTPRLVKYMTQHSLSFDPSETLHKLFEFKRNNDIFLSSTHKGPLLIPKKI